LGSSTLSLTLTPFNGPAVLVRRSARIWYRSASGRSGKGEHEAAIDLKAVAGIGAEIVLT